MDFILYGQVFKIYLIRTFSVHVDSARWCIIVLVHVFPKQICELLHGRTFIFQLLKGYPHILRSFLRVFSQIGGEKLTETVFQGFPEPLDGLCLSMVWCRVNLIDSQLFGKGKREIFIE